MDISLTIIWIQSRPGSRYESDKSDVETEVSTYLLRFRFRMGFTGADQIVKTGSGSYLISNSDCFTDPGGKLLNGNGSYVLTLLMFSDELTTVKTAWSYAKSTEDLTNAGTYIRW